MMDLSNFDVRIEKSELLVGAKHGILDESVPVIYLSPAMWSLTIEENDAAERDRMLSNIKLIVINSKKQKESLYAPIASKWNP